MMISSFNIDFFLSETKQKKFLHSLSSFFQLNRSERALSARQNMTFFPLILSLVSAALRGEGRVVVVAGEKDDLH